MKVNNRKSIFEDLKKFSIFAKEGDFIEVTEWTNGEGVDISLGSSQGTRNISLTWGELDAINYLVLGLKYEKVSE